MTFTLDDMIEICRGDIVFAEFKGRTEAEKFHRARLKLLLKYRRKGLNFCIDDDDEDDQDDQDE